MSERDRVREFLESQSTLALATVNADQLPEIAPLFYVSDHDLNLYWLSSRSSRHSYNIAAKQQVAVTIYPHIWQWTDIRGLQIEGIAGIVNEPQKRAEILNLYSDKFKLPPSFDAQIAASTLYVLFPVWIRWLDNSVKFGYKTEIKPD